MQGIFYSYTWLEIWNKINENQIKFSNDAFLLEKNVNRERIKYFEIIVKD